MNFEQYQALFQDIIDGKNEDPTYANEDMMQYTKMNHARMNRWLKTYKVPQEIISALANIKAPQKWIIITEPWCGDAAHIVPILHLMATTQALITVELQLRDSEPFLIDQYLTNGSKSIPILIIRNADNKDLAVWGPRPKGATALMANMKAEALPFEDMKIALQKWYNNDNANEIVHEIAKIATAY